MARGEGSDEAPSRRRPGRPGVVTYRVRVDLEETSPPLWRRLELASDLYLDEVHAVIQAAFGWTDSHLHRFGSGPEYYSRDTEYYLCRSRWPKARPAFRKTRCGSTRFSTTSAAGCSTATTSVTTGSTSSSLKPSSPATNPRRGRPAPPGAARARPRTAAACTATS